MPTAEDSMMLSLNIDFNKSVRMMLITGRKKYKKHASLL